MTDLGHAHFWHKSTNRFRCLEHQTYTDKLQTVALCHTPSIHIIELFLLTDKGGPVHLECFSDTFVYCWIFCKYLWILPNFHIRLKWNFMMHWINLLGGQRLQGSLLSFSKARTNAPTVLSVKCFHSGPLAPSAISRSLGRLPAEACAEINSPWPSVFSFQQEHLGPFLMESHVCSHCVHKTVCVSVSVCMRVCVIRPPVSEVISRSCVSWLSLCRTGDCSRRFLSMNTHLQPKAHTHTHIYTYWHTLAGDCLENKVAPWVETGVAEVCVCVSMLLCVCVCVSLQLCWVGRWCLCGCGRGFVTFSIVMPSQMLWLDELHLWHARASRFYRVEIKPFLQTWITSRSIFFNE